MLASGQVSNRHEPPETSHPSETGRDTTERTALTPTVGPAGGAWTATGEPLFTRGELVADRFRILRLLGRGGGGQVFEADDLLLGRRVALKAVHPELLRDHEALERLRSEVLLARQVTDPHVCRIFDVARHELAVEDGAGGPEGETLVAAMELLEGETLAHRLRREGDLARPEAAAIAEQLARGMAAAHAAGVLHLDFKGANVLLTREAGSPRAVITDFGLAVSSRAGHGGGGARSPGGTPGYVAPEMRRGLTPSPATDVYSFGCVLHEMLAGSLPAGPGRASRDRLPPRWRSLVSRCLAERPAERPADGAAVLREVLRIGERHARRRLPTLAGQVVLTAALGAVLLWLWAATPPEPGVPVAGGFSQALRAGLDPLRARPGDPVAARAFREGLEALRDLDPVRARARFETVVERAPRFAPARAVLSETWERLGDLDEAREEALRAARLESRRRETRLFLEARRLETERAWSEAAERRRHLDALFPDDPGHTVRRIAVHLADNDPEEADRVLEGWRSRGVADAWEPRFWIVAAEVAKALEESERQLDAARRAVAAGERRSRTGVTASGRLLESNALFTLGQQDHGRAAVDSALALSVELGDERLRMMALIQKATIGADLDGEREEAQAIYRRALRIARRLGNRPAEARILQNLSAEAYQLGDIDRAEERLLEARALYQALDHRDGLASVAGNMALIHTSRGDFARAEEAFEEAVRIRREEGPPESSALLLNNLGVLYARRGEIRRARATWTESEELARESGNRVVEVLATRNLAQLAAKSGDLRTASQWLSDGLTSDLEALGILALTGEVALVRGDLALFADDRDAAEGFFETARSTFDEAGLAVAVAKASVALAEVHELEGRYPRAEALARQAEAVLSGAGDESLLVRARCRLARALVGQRRLDEAESVLRSLTGESLAEAPGSDDDLDVVMLVAIARGRYRLAAGEPERVPSALEAAISRLPPGWLVPERLEARLLQAAAERALGNAAESARLLRQVAAEAERGGYVLYARQARRGLTSGETPGVPPAP